MKRSTDRILTTHAGRLPDPSNMGEVVAARTGDQGKYDELVKPASWRWWASRSS